METERLFVQNISLPFRDHTQNNLVEKIWNQHLRAQIIKLKAPGSRLCLFTSCSKWKLPILKEKTRQHTGSHPVTQKTRPQSASIVSWIKSYISAAACMNQDLVVLQWFSHKARLISNNTFHLVPRSEISLSVAFTLARLNMQPIKRCLCSITQVGCAVHWF